MKLPNYLTSITKLVLLMLAITLNVGVFLKIIPIQDFMGVVNLVFGYYFGRTLPESLAKNSDGTCPICGNKHNDITL